MQLPCLTFVKPQEQKKRLRVLLTFQGSLFQRSLPLRLIPVLVQKTVSRHLEPPESENKQNRSLTFTE